jgi:hypothetical protein
MAIAGTLLGVAITGFVAARSRILRKKQLIGDAENERTRLIAGEDRERGITG